VAREDEMGERASLDALISMALDPEDSPDQMRAMDDLIALARSDQAARAALVNVYNAREAMRGAGIEDENGDMRGMSHGGRKSLRRHGIAFNH